MPWRVSSVKLGIVTHLNMNVFLKIVRIASDKCGEKGAHQRGVVTVLGTWNRHRHYGRQN